MISKSVAILSPMTEPCDPCPQSMTDTTIDTSKTIAEMSYADIRNVYESYRRSEIAHVAEHLSHVLDNPKYVLSNWEIDQLQKVFEKFEAKYTSPLAKAMK